MHFLLSLITRFIYSKYHIFSWTIGQYCIGIRYVITVQTPIKLFTPCVLIPFLPTIFHFQNNSNIVNVPAVLNTKYRRFTISLASVKQLLQIALWSSCLSNASDLYI